MGGGNYILAAPLQDSTLCDEALYREGQYPKIQENLGAKEIIVGEEVGAESASSCATTRRRPSVSMPTGKSSGSSKRSWPATRAWTPPKSELWSFGPRSAATATSR